MKVLVESGKEKARRLPRYDQITSDSTVMEFNFDLCAESVSCSTRNRRYCPLRYFLNRKNRVGCLRCPGLSV